MAAAEAHKTSFRKLMALRQTGEDTFESLTSAFSPGDLPIVGNRAFGGHAYAQAIWAASRTVADGFHLHNVTGHFLVAGRVDVPFVYRVKRIRDGNGYCLRSVEVLQDSRTVKEEKSTCFFATLSFKRDESGSELVKYSHQDATRDHVQKQYGVVLDGKDVEEHPLAPTFDAGWLLEEYRTKELFPGCDMRKVDMDIYNGVAIEGGGKDGEIASHWRQLTFYRLVLDETKHEEENDLNLHAAAHSYASDRNGLFMIQRAMGYDHQPSILGSLAHTVIFHGGSESLRMTDSNGRPKWFVSEAWTSNSGDNRICHNSRLWDYGTGEIVATTVQDGMMRVPLGGVSKL